MSGDTSNIIFCEFNCGSSIDIISDMWLDALTPVFGDVSFDAFHDGHILEKFGRNHGTIFNQDCLIVFRERVKRVIMIKHSY